ncbi:MAG: MBL fold metallo-hydrolase [bacterium TMED46]|nr:MAG: MBL fold metallo-hydrolase [bacterium TMED46]|tara:strand:- start:3488 stop:4336 length:849 start_codon:yes stop_codon:yes gene_type:complete
MKIGDYDLYSIETSEFSLDGGAMFGIIPKPIWERKAPSDALNRIDMVTRSLLLCSDERKILIDTGNGTKWEEKYRHIYNINTSRYNIENSLTKYGFSADDITDIINTHLHFDHAGGNTKIDDGSIVPTFPNAKYWVTKEHWELANHPSQKDSGSFIEHDWKVLAENGMIETVNGNEPFIKGIDSYITQGHTAGLLHPMISDGTKTLFYGADIFPLAAHISIPWVMAYDVQPVVTMKEKEILLPKMQDEEWILFLEHDPNIQACTVHQDGKHFKMNESVLISE